MLISAKNLSKEFKVKQKRAGSIFKRKITTLKAVENVNFEIEKGEIVAFIGPNGAGKSTTIKMLTGIIQPSYGNILIEGLNPCNDRQNLAYKIGCMFGQKSQLYMHLSVIDSFRLLGSIYDMSKIQTEKRIEEISDMFKISHLLDKTVRKLSLGQRMICEIAGSIIHDPDIIFLDEPTIGLDIVAKLRIREIILKLNKERGTTIFLTSHDVSDVEALCNRIIIINNGIIVNDSSIDTLKSLYLNKKSITIYYKEEIENIYMSHYNILEKVGNKVVISVDTNKENIAEVLAYFISFSNVADIQISSTPMEDIIKSIYEKRDNI